MSERDKEQRESCTAVINATEYLKPNDNEELWAWLGFDYLDKLRGTRDYQETMKGKSEAHITIIIIFYFYLLDDGKNNLPF